MLTHQGARMWLWRKGLDKVGGGRRFQVASCFGMCGAINKLRNNIGVKIVVFTPILHSSYLSGCGQMRFRIQDCQLSTHPLVSGDHDIPDLGKQFHIGW